MSQEVFRKAEITPSEISAGDSDEFIIRLVVGPGYTDGPSRLMLDFDATLGTSCPTRLINEASGYVETYVTNPEVAYTMRIWDMALRRFVDRDSPSSREGGRMLVLGLSAGLTEGDIVEIHWGETTRGFGPGAKVTSVVPRPGHHSSIVVRYFDSQEKGLPDYGYSYPGYQRPEPQAETELTFLVKPRDLRRIRVIRQWNRALLVPYDRFWNVADVTRFEDIARADASPQRNEQGTFEFDTPHVSVRSHSVPLIDSPAMDNVFEGMNLYWGDLHTHSNHSCDCARTVRMEMMPGELMRFARDRAGLDFFGVTDHHVPGDERGCLIQAHQWRRLIDDVQDHHRPDDFVVFPGFEMTCPRGDTIVLFKGEPGYEIIDQDFGDIRDVWRIIEGVDYMSIPHFHTAGARLPEGVWWAHPEPEHEPALEVFSDHGSYEREDVLESGRAERKPFRYDRCGAYFLSQGYRYGFVAHSDDHKGHVGVNGLTAIFAETLDRESVFEAYRARRTYATSNARIRLIFTVNGQLMGSVIPNEGRNNVHIDVAGEGPLKKVDLFRNGELFRRFTPAGLTFEADVTVEEDEPSNWYVRVTQLDNHIAISSPVWLC